MVRSRLIYFEISILLLTSAVGASRPPPARGAAPAAPAALTFTVNNIFDVAANFGNDLGFTVCHTATNNNICTLRAAIMNANRHAGGATIIVPSQTYVLSLAPVGADDDASGDLNITGTVTLLGSGSASTIADGAGLDGVFVIEAGGFVTLTGLTIRNGNAGFTGGGGGIYNHGRLTLNDSVVSENSAGLGGGILNDLATTLLVHHSTIRDNRAVLNSGGGIESLGLLTIENSTINGNQALVGGGISTRSPGSLTVANSTISGNSVTGYGGGVAALGSATFFQTTIAGNLADSDAAAGGDGGGIYASVSGSVNVWNTLFAFNYVSDTVSECGGNGLTSDDYNYFQTTTGCTIAGSATHDVLGDPALLGPLQDNGGGTETRALWVGSQALDQIPPARCRDQFGAAPVPDQRGVARPIGGLCDIGAYEGAQARPLYGQNLILNGDAEAAAGSSAGAFVGVPYWIVDTGQFTAVPYNAPGGFPSVPTDTVPSNRGHNFFAGGSATLSVGVQVISVSAASAAIDAGGIHYTLSADLGGYDSQTDNATLTVTFLDETVSVISGPVGIGPVTAGDRNNQTGLLHRSLTALVPAGSRSIQVVLTQSGTAGYNDGYADNVSLVLTPPYALFLPLTRR